MFLTDKNILHYLLARGLVTPSAAVDGDVQIIQGERRHRHFRIERQHGPGLFVKQVKQWDPATQACLEREAACYRLAAGDDGFAALREWVPAFRDWDPARRVLSVELFAGAKNFTQYHGQEGTAPAEIAGEVGTMLGQWHREIRLEPGDPRLGHLFEGRVPWILVLHRNPAQGFHPQGHGAHYVADTLRRDPTLSQAMEELARRYRPTCLIHGDVKWDNLLVTGDGDGNGVRIVDWEIADVGDPLWDVAGVFQSYLVFWLLSMPLTSGVAPAQIEQQANFPLPEIQPAFRAFWDAYLEARDLAGGDAEAALTTALRYTAARMTQTTYEAGVTYGQAIPQLRYMMQLAQNTLLKTDDAVHDLLGM